MVSYWVLIPAVLASATAIWVAYWVYPHQKELDRAIQIRTEKRSSIIEYLESSQDYVDSWNRRERDDTVKTQARFEAATRKLMLFISNDEVSALKESYNAAKDYGKSVSKWAKAKLDGKDEDRKKYYADRKLNWEKWQTSRNNFIAVSRAEFTRGSPESDEVIKLLTSGSILKLEDNAEKDVASIG
ncbi:hypothetical protein LZ686_15085 [Paracoccus sp. NFXS7]|uniref:hypothetical protein n=1 Tax=Paracoccus sp. NFXS7 TaxID=2908653 RepID=UPI0032DF98FB